MDQWATQEEDNKSARFCYWFTKDRQLNRTTGNVCSRTTRGAVVSPFGKSFFLGSFLWAPVMGFTNRCKSLLVLALDFTCWCTIVMHDAPKEADLANVDSRSLANVRPAVWVTHHICLSLYTLLVVFLQLQLCKESWNNDNEFGDGGGDGVRIECEGCYQSWSWDSSCHFTSTCHSEHVANGTFSKWLFLKTRLKRWTGDFCFREAPI